MSLPPKRPAWLPINPGWASREPGDIKHCNLMKFVDGNEYKIAITCKDQPGEHFIASGITASKAERLSLMARQSKFYAYCPMDKPETLKSKWNGFLSHLRLQLRH